MLSNKSEFGIITRLDGSKSLRFNSTRAIECCNFAIDNGLKNLSLDSDIYKDLDLKPILPLKTFVEELIIDENINISQIHDFTNLLSLSIIGNKNNLVCLEKFIKLEALNVTFSKNLHGLDKCKKLKSLTIEGFKSKALDLSDLPLLPELNYLTIIKSDIANLNGVEKFKLLNEINFWYCSKLESIESLKTLNKNLLKIEFESCKKIKD